MENASSYRRPLPAVTPANREFWRASTQGRLVLPHCRRCDHVWFPPSPRCPRCLGCDRVALREASGRGRLWSWIVMHRRYLPEFPPPYVVAFVELEEGPMLMSTIVDAPPERLRCDLPLQAVFEPATPEMAILKFRPVG
jgi:uncharacterized OB-fold protein